MKKFLSIELFLLAAVSFLCAGGRNELNKQTVAYVDLSKFSGDWYILAEIPTVFEKDAVNGVKNYSINDDGTIRVRYKFRKGGPGGKESIMFQKGWVVNTKTNAEWKVQPLWPLKFPYYILDLADDYSYTVIGTNNYDYLWIMARQPQMDSTMLEMLIQKMEILEYNREKFQIMEQSWGD